MPYDISPALSAHFSGAPEAAGQIGPYDLVRPIGRGGMAEVWLGVHTMFHTPAALKILQGSVAGAGADPTVSQRLLREVRAVAGLRHPGVVDVLDFGVIGGAEVRVLSALEPEQTWAEGRPWIAMEYAPHGDLSTVVGPTPWPVLQGALLQVLDALAHAHARHIIHLDIKPANILIRRTFGAVELLLTDFGLAHFAAPEQGQPHRPILAGTPHYMSPEQLRGQWRCYGPWTDLYALGCVAFELATGCPPFDGERAVDIARKHISEPPPDLSPWLGLPARFGDWLRRMLSKDPEVRFERAADAAFQLARIQPVPRGEVEKQMYSFFGGEAGDEVIDQLLGPPALTLQGRPSGEPAGATTLQPLVVTTALRTGRALPIPNAGGLDRHRGLMESLPPQPITWRESEGGQPGLPHGLSLFGLRRPPLTGRVPERNHLWSSLRWVKSQGRSRMIQLRGESGVGKTALIRWLCQRAEELGAAYTLRVNHSALPSPDDGLPAALRRSFREEGMRQGALQDEVLQQLGWLAPDLDGPGRMWLSGALAELMIPDEAEICGGGRVGLHRFSAIGEWLRILARRRPMIVWLDAAQWGADALRLAQYLLSHDLQAPILIVATIGDEAQLDGRVEADLLQSLSRSPQSEIMELAEPNRAVLTLLLQDEMGLSGELTTALLDQAGGSTLYALQAVSHWVERGLLIPSTRGYVVAEEALSDLPTELEALALSRLWWAARQTADPEEAMAALELAAVLGRTLYVPILEAACAGLGISLPEGLIRTLLNGGLAQGDERRWTFCYEAIRGALLSRAARRHRLEILHGACADALSAGGCSACQFLAAKQALHRVESGGLDQALDSLQGAVEAWLTVGDHVRSVAILEILITTLERDAPGMANYDERRMWALSRLAESHHHLGQRQEAAQARLRLRRVVEVYDCPEGWAALFRLEAMSALAEGEVEAAQRAYVEASRVYGKLGDAVGQVRSVRGEGWTLIAQGMHEVACDRFTAALALLGEAASHRLERAWCLHGLAAARIWGELSEDEETVLEAQAIFKDLGAINGLASTRLLEGCLAWRAGDPSEAIRRFEVAVGLWSETGSQHLAVGLLHLAMVRWSTAAVEQGRAVLERIAEHHLDALPYRWRPVLWTLMAAVKGQQRGAREVEMTMAHAWRIFSACGVYPHPMARGLMVTVGRWMRDAGCHVAGGQALRIAAGCWRPFDPGQAGKLEAEASAE